MTTINETAFLALVEALATAAAAPGSPLPAPRRNVFVPARLDQIKQAFVNVVDGDTAPTDAEAVLLGDGEGEVEYRLRAEIEVIVYGAEDDATRDTALDALLAAIRDALLVDRTLGGACHWLAITAVRRLGLTTEGQSPRHRGVLVEVALLLSAASILG